MREALLRYGLYVIDVFVVTILFYWLFLLVRGTRAVQALKGLLILLIVAFIAQGLGLTTFNFLVKGLWQVLILAFIILFAPEIRRALAEVGQRRFFRGFLKEAKPGYLDQIIEAVDILSKKKKGALIALERETGLKTYIETGIRIDSEVSRELLSTIFLPNTPLHDGAVIIQGNRVAAAGCLLPFTRNPDVSKRIGMRHRAALGLSEETDAVVVIVSEETGKISLAVGGRLTRDLDGTTLSKTVKNLLFHPVLKEGEKK
ncbi:MAG TPA: TIGR00159 family protein [bacterium]|nr:TIGR00159 family protein [bacterium]